VRRQRKHGGGAQRDCGGSLAAAQWRRQRGGGGSLAAAAWRRQWQSGGGAQRDGGGSLAVARRRRQLGGGILAAASGGSLAAVAWRGQLGSFAAVAAERWRRSARRRWQLGRGGGTKINNQLKAR
jgi:hypothetical protein